MKNKSILSDINKIYDDLVARVIEDLKKDNRNIIRKLAVERFRKKRQKLSRR